MSTQKPPSGEQFEKLSHVASKLLDEDDPEAAIRIAREMSALLDEMIGQRKRH